MTRTEKNTNKKLYIVLQAGFLLSLLPIIVLAFFNYPAADDLSASDTAYWAWRDTGSLLEVIRAAWENVEYNYRNWSGVFASVFWTSLQPGIFGEEFYGMTTVITLALLLLGGFYLGHTLGCRYFKVDRFTMGCITILYLFTTIQLMPDGNEGLYWHAGVANYTWAFAFLLLLIGILLSLRKEERRAVKTGKLILACILSLLVGGGNFITALQGSLWLILLTLFFCFIDWKGGHGESGKEKSQRSEEGTARGKAGNVIVQNFPFILCTVVILCSFLAAVLAPGNAVRMGSAQGMGVAEAILASFKYGIKMPLTGWFRWPIFALVILALPLMWQIADNLQYQFSCPLVVLALAYCLVSAGFTPSLYAQGAVAAGRLQDTVYFLYILALYSVTFYLTGWVNRCCREKSFSWTYRWFNRKKGGWTDGQSGERSPQTDSQHEERSLQTDSQSEERSPQTDSQSGERNPQTGGREEKARLLPWGILAAFILVSVFHLGINRNLYIGTEAARTLISGQAEVYRQENEERLQLLKAEGSRQVIVKPFSDPPELLLFQDISFDEKEWINTVVALYYGKESVRVGD